MTSPILYALSALLGLVALITVDLAILHQSQAVGAWGCLVAIGAGVLAGRARK